MTRDRSGSGRTPSAEALFDHLADLYRGGRSLERRLSPSTVTRSVTDEVTGIRIHSDHVRDRERGNRRHHPAAIPSHTRDGSFAKVTTGPPTKSGRRRSRAEDCVRVLGEASSPEGRPRAESPWPVELLGDDVLSGGTPTVRQVRALHRELRRPPLPTALSLWTPATFPRAATPWTI